MEDKLIDWRLFDPRNAIFKSSKNDRAEFKQVYCSNSGNCQAFKEGSCTMLNMFSEKCPYGSLKVEIGFTRRARKFGSWIKEKKESVEETPQLKNTNRKIFTCGEFIFFNFPFWNVAGVDGKYQSGFFGGSKDYIAVSDFTIDFVANIIRKRPKSMMGDEITSYQKEEVPKMLLALNSWNSSFMEELFVKYPDIKKKFDSISYIGMKALAYTLKPGCFYQFERYGLSTWNGESFVIEDYNNAFMPIRGKAQMEIIPYKKEIVKITSNDQVFEGTKFV